MSDVSANLTLPFLQPSQAQKHVTHNEALQRLDLLVQLSVEGFGAQEPPQSPAEGEIHALGLAPQGAWAGQPDMLAAWSGGAWVFITPRDGWRAWGRAEQALYLRRGGAWADIGSLVELDNVAGIGIGTQSDAVNRLAVTAPATLLSHEGGGHQLKINKAAPGDTASLLYQTAFSGRAEIGLAGTDDLAIKVSADGTNFVEALHVSADTGRPVLPQGATVQGNVTGTAVTQDQTDATAGRLLKVGDFGLGTPAGAAQPQVTLNTATLPGQYGYLATDPAAPSGNSGMVTVQRYASQSLRQVASPASLDLCWQRRSTDGGTSWTAWVPVYTAGNAVGPVAQVAGKPTGAIVERGSNANGDYIRHADGTQMCWKRFQLTGQNITTASGAFFVSGNLMLGRDDFPAAFSAPPACTYAAVATGMVTGVLLGGAGTALRFANTLVAFRMTAASGVTLDVSCTAVGRWF